MAILPALVLAVGWRFLQNPTRLAPTLDPAWYAWRTRTLLDVGPTVLIEKHGPFGMLSGGYRITTPVLGALLNRVAGVSPIRFTVLMAIGLPALTAVALAAFAYRHKRDPILFVLTAFAAAPLFLTIPYIGYMDNLMALFLLAVGLSFLEPSREYWGPRVALGLLLFLATLTHPTTALLFMLTLLAGTGVRLLGTRFSIRKTMERDGPMLLAAGAGLVLALIAWKAGMWGPRASLSDAVLTQPYTGEFFRGRLREWVRSLHPKITIPVAALGVSWVLWQLARRRPIDRHSAMSVMWLLPLLGTFGFMFDYAYPYYRFINITLAPMLLVGLGAWVVTRGFRWLGSKIGDRAHILPAVGVLVVILGLVTSYFQPGLRLWNAQSGWFSPRLRITMAAARAYAAGEPARPIVFIIHPRPEVIRAWGLAKQDSNVTLAGLDGAEVTRTYMYVGDPAEFIAGQPTVTGYPIFDRLSRGFLDDLRAGLARYAEAPVVLYLPQLNASGTPPTESQAVQIALGVQLLQGPDLAAPSPEAAEAAAQARDSEVRAQARPPGRAHDPAHLARVIGGILLLMALPGLIAMRWFRLDDMPSRIALIPGLSLAMVTAAAILVIVVHRGPFGAADGWASLGLAFVAAIGLARLAHRRQGTQASARAGPENSAVTAGDGPRQDAAWTGR